MGRGAAEAPGRRRAAGESDAGECVVVGVEVVVAVVSVVVVAPLISVC